MGFKCNLRLNKCVTEHGKTDMDQDCKDGASKSKLETLTLSAAEARVVVYPDHKLEG